MNKQIIKNDKLLNELEPYCILKGYRGSIAHNTYEEDVTHDDKDVMGIFVPPEDVIFGLKSMETVERMVEEKLSQKRTVTWDIVYYSLPKYLNLVLKQNPNVLCLLWLSEKHYIKKSSLGDKLVKNRHKLISKECYKSFSGYAYGQLKRLGSSVKRYKEMLIKARLDVPDSVTLEEVLREIDRRK